MEDFSCKISEVKDRLNHALRKAQSLGADASDFLYVAGRSVNFSCRNGKTEHLERSEGADLGLRLFVGQKQAVVSTSDTSPKSLEALVERAFSMAQAVPEDPYAGLAVPALLAKNIPNLDIMDVAIPSEEELMKQALECEEAALQVSGITLSEGASASWGDSEALLMTSTGFCGSYKESNRSFSVSVIAGQAEGMERDYAYSSAIYAKDLKTPQEVGKEAAERTLKRLNPRKVKTTQVPIILEPRVSSSILGHLASAINGATVARGTSFLREALGTSLFPSSITILDDPHRKRGFRSRPFDVEGIETKARAIIEEGILQTWILDCRSARQLKLQTTGHASRGTGSIPSPSVSNFYMLPGKESPQDLIKSLKTGLYITDLIGQGVNIVTGDYSRGVTGFWIENGELVYPVSEITIAGNLKEMFQKIVPCSDLEFQYGIDAPTLMIENMTIAGS